MPEPTQQSHPTYDQIAAAAYHLWEEAGRPSGQDEEMWLRAEHSLRRAAPAQLATPPPPATDRETQPRPPLFEKPPARRGKKKV